MNKIFSLIIAITIISFPAWVFADTYDDGFTPIPAYEMNYINDFELMVAPSSEVHQTPVTIDVESALPADSQNSHFSTRSRATRQREEPGWML